MEISVNTCHLSPMKKTDMENADNKLFENRLSAENADTSKNMKLLPHPCEFSMKIEISSYADDVSADDNSDLLLVFSILSSSSSVYYCFSIKIIASVTCSFCLKCFKHLLTNSNIVYDCNNILSCCTMCKNLNKTYQSILYEFKNQYDKYLTVAENAENLNITEELEILIKKFDRTINHFYSMLSKCKAEHDLLELCCLQYSQLQLQFLMLNELCETNRKLALPELKMEI